MKVEVSIPTKDRYPNLSLLLWSLCEQSYKEFEITIIDDSENRADIRELPFITPILKRLDSEGHNWRVKFGSKKGPHHCHQLSIDEARHPLIFRCDDDCVLDFQALENLVKTWDDLSSKESIGAIAPIVLDPQIPKEVEFLPVGYRSFKKFQGKLDEYGVNYGDQQWRRHPDRELQKVEHLYSSFLYSVDAAKEIGGYDLDYNVVGHREETDFTYRLFKKDYSLYIQPTALVWHLRNPVGGIRTYNQSSLWAECQEHYLNKFSFKRGKNKDRIINVFGGLGDHLCATPMLRALRRSGKKVVVTATYPYLLQGNPNIDELIFNGDENAYEKVDFRDLYKWAFETGYNGKLSKAWCKLFGVDWDGDVLDYTIFPQERKWVEDRKLGDYVLFSTEAGIPAVQYGDANAVGAAKKRTNSKDWVANRWEKLVKEIKNMGLQVYQVGSSLDSKVSGCDEYFLGGDYRIGIALLEKSKCFVSVDTFLNHAGHAIGKRGVVLFGPSDPNIFGHESNINLYYPDSCLERKCLWGENSQWRSQLSCDDKKCMKFIEVREVVEKVKELILEN